VFWRRRWPKKVEPSGEVVRHTAGIEAGSCPERLSHIVVKRRDHVHRRLSGRNETRSVVDRHSQIVEMVVVVSSEYALYSDWDLVNRQRDEFLLDSVYTGSSGRQRDPIR
jgi:hypothetical protein